MEQKLLLGQLYGRTLRRREVAGFMLVENVYSSGLRLPQHSHEHAGFCYVLQGSFERTYERGIQDCLPASLSFHPPDEKHSERFDVAGARLFSLLLTRELLERVRECLVIRDSVAVFRGGPPSQLAMRLYREFHRMDEVSPLAIEGLALEILAETSRSSAPRSERRPVRWLEQAREMLHAQFTEPLTLAAVAQVVKVHPVHLARTFRRHYHCTVGEYLRQLRIEFSCRELAASDAPLSEIALLAGFCSQSHFSTAFKLRTGMTPAEYRLTFRSRQSS